MADRGTRVVDRPLQPDELRLLQWLIDQSHAREALRTQLPGLKVVGECPCGCASFDLEPMRGDARPAVGDAQVRFAFDRSGPNFCDGLLWVSGGWLAGVDLVSQGDCPPCRLPSPEDIEEVVPC